MKSESLFFVGARQIFTCSQCGTSSQIVLEWPTRSMTAVVMIFVLTETEPGFSKIVLEMFFFFFGGNVWKEMVQPPLSKSNLQKLVFLKKIRCCGISSFRPGTWLRRLHGLWCLDFRKGDGLRCPLCLGKASRYVDPTLAGFRSFSDEKSWSAISTVDQ